MALCDLDTDEIQTEAEKAMGIDTETADILFGYADGWPEQFTFQAHRTPQSEQVEKACAILDFIVAGGNLEEERQRDCVDQ
jgi:hypothetical protein